jgi:hypothetical protein
MKKYLKKIKDDYQSVVKELKDSYNDPSGKGADEKKIKKLKAALAEKEIVLNLAVKASVAGLSATEIKTLAKAI